MKIEFVKPEDAAELLAIYAPYVSETAISFEYEVPTLEDFIYRQIYSRPRRKTGFSF